MVTEVEISFNRTNKVVIPFYKMSKSQLKYLREAIVAELKARAPKMVDAHTFVSELRDAYRGNHNAEWIASKLGMKLSTVKSRIRELKKEWVKMVEMGEVSGPFPYVI